VPARWARLRCRAGMSGFVSDIRLGSGCGGLERASKSESGPATAEAGERNRACSPPQNNTAGVSVEQWQLSPGPAQRAESAEVRNKRIIDSFATEVSPEFARMDFRSQTGMGTCGDFNDNALNYLCWLSEH
jgi:hypothetical protein